MVASCRKEERLMIVFDLEWNRGYDKTPLEEILQIGAVKLDRLGGRILDTFCVFIHPCVHRRLNRTAKVLPELQQSFDSPYDFPTAMRMFIDWCGDDTVFVDWGGDDFDTLRQNCEFWKVPAPEATEFLDLQMAFSLRVGTNQGVALYRAVEYCGIPDSFTFHNALHDAVYTALVSAWINADALALLALPKEVRRLQNAPVFPPQGVRVAGGYISRQSALSGRGSRRQICPLCGESTWVRRWHTAGDDLYYADFRCKEHGSFLCRLQLKQDPAGTWLGEVSVPAITPALLQEYDRAIRTGSVACKGDRKPPHRRRKNRRTPPKTT